MSRLTIPLCVCALLAASALPQAAEVDPADAAPGSTGDVGSIGANDGACADATSDYERYELGCPVDVPSELGVSHAPSQD